MSQSAYISQNGNVTTAFTTNPLTGGLTVPVLGEGSLGIDVRGTFTATLIPEGSIDNTNWFTLTINPQAGGAGVTSITAAGSWTIGCAGFAAVRLRCSAFTSGTATCTVVGITAVGTQANITVTADTEFPAAAALNGTWAKTTSTTIVGAAVMANDGTNEVLVGLGAGTAATALRVELPTDGTGQVKTDITKVAGTAIVTGGVAGSQSIGGTVATNVNITANPLNLGAQAVSSENTAVTTARQVQLVADLTGKLIVLPYANPENSVSGTTASMTGTTSTSLIAAPAAGLRNYITSITVSNSHATVGTNLLIQDGSGGTTLWVIPAAAVYGGGTVHFPTPLRQPTTATAIFCQNETTGAAVKASAAGYKGA